MRWLVRLITPPGGTVLDPFAGSGTTLEACLIEGFPAIGIEKQPEYAGLCVARLSKPIQPAIALNINDAPADVSRARIQPRQDALDFDGAA